MFDTLLQKEHMWGYFQNRCSPDYS